MSFTAEEITAAVEKLVRGSIRKPIDALGVRTTETTFNDMQEAAAGVFLLYFNAPFYVAFLGTRRLKELVDTELFVIDDLIEALKSTDRITRPITDLTSLANARTALGELESALDERTTEFEDFENVPAFRRYARNLDSFLGDARRNIVDGGDIVPTPQQARKDIPGLVSDLKASHEEIVRVATSLKSAMDDFDSLALPSLLAQGTISRSREVLQERYDELNELGEVERLEKIREIALDLVAQKAVVRKFGAATKPSVYLNLEGTGTPFSDATHLATPARLETDTAGPYVLVEDRSSIEFAVDGGTPATFPLPLSYVAEVTGSIAEPYSIVAFVNDQIQIEIPEGTVVVTLPAGLAISAASVVAVVNVSLAVLGPYTRMEAYFLPKKFDSLFDITSLGGNNAKFTLIAPSGGLNGFALEVGDLLLVKTGANAGTLWTITLIDPLFQFVDTTAFSPIAPVIPELSQQCEVGPPDRALRLVETDDLVSVTNRRLVTVAASGAFTPTRPDLGAQTIGFAPGQFAQSAPTTAQTIVDSVNQSLSNLEAETVFFASYYTGTARSAVGDSKKVVLYLSRASGVAVTAGLIVTFTVTLDSVPIGGIIVIRASSATSNIDLAGVIIGATFTTVTASMIAPVVADLNTEIEIGLNLAYTYGAMLVITDGPNQGRYMVTNDPPLLGAGIPFEVSIDRSLVSSTNGNLPVFFNAQLGVEGVAFSSKAETVASEVVADYGQVGAQSGITASIVVVGPVVTITGLTGMTAASVGRRLKLSGAAVAANNGTFPIASFISATSVTITNPAAVTDPNNGIIAWSEKNTAADLFFTAVPATANGTTPYLELSDYPKEASSGDILDLYETQYNVVSQSFDVTSVEPDNSLIKIDPEITSIASLDFTNDIPPPFAKLRVGQVATFTEFETQVQTWLDQPENQALFFTNLNRLINPLLVNKNPTLVEVNTAVAEVESLRELLVQDNSPSPTSTLEYALVNYSVDPVEPVDILVKSFKERGSDRALDILLEGGFTTFFGLNMHNVSHAGALLETIRNISREDLAIRKFNRKDAFSNRLLNSAEDGEDFEFDTHDADAQPPPDPPIGSDTV